MASFNTHIFIYIYILQAQHSYVWKAVQCWTSWCFIAGSPSQLSRQASSLFCMNFGFTQCQAFSSKNFKIHFVSLFLSRSWQTLFNSESKKHLGFWLLLSLWERKWNTNRSCFQVQSSKKGVTIKKSLEISHLVIVHCSTHIANMVYEA